jgi:Tol biopolymer transport system component
MVEAKALLGEAANLTTSSSAGMAASPATAPRRRFRQRFGLGLGALALVAVGVVSGRLLWKTSGAASQGSVHRFQIEHRTGGSASISPDGKHIAYVDGEKLRIRDLDRLESREVPGSEKASQPFWSPDGRDVAFVAGELLRRAPIDGGPVRTVCELKPVGFLYLGSTWGPSGSIVVALGPGRGLFEVSAEGGELRPLLEPDPAKDFFDFHGPSFLPDGRSILLVVHPRTNSRFYLAVFDGREVRRLLPESTAFADFPVYSKSGHLLFNHLEGIASLHAVPFDASTLTVTGEPVRLSEDAGFPSVSADGVLVYISGSGLGDLVLVNRSGQIERTISSGHQAIRFPRVSPDGKRVMLGDQKDWNRDIWAEDIERGTRVRLTTGPEPGTAGAWSASGERVVLLSGHDVVLKRADGSGQAERLPFQSNPAPEAIAVSPDWSPDGRFVIYRSDGDLWYGDVAGKGAPVAFAKSPFTESEGRFSPDGRFVAYMSDESGRFEVYVRPFPEGDGKWTLSAGGGALPRWSRRGDELFYVEGNTLMVVSISTRDGFRSSPPRKLFDATAIGAAAAGFSPLLATYDPMPDGQGFVLARRVPGATKIVVVENWAAELKRRP